MICLPDSAVSLVVTSVVEIVESGSPVVLVATALVDIVECGLG